MKNPPNKHKSIMMIHNFRIILAIVICLTQIALVKFTQKSMKLSQAETAALNRTVQILPYKESVQTLFEISDNISKHATL